MAGKSPVTTPEFHRGRAPGNKGETYPPEALDRAEVLRLLAANDARRTQSKVRDRALLVTLYRTGLRISEALSLNVKDVDFENHSVNVLRGKGNKRRTVGIDDWTLTELQKWLDVRDAPMGAPIFCTRDGKRMYSTYFRAVLHKLGQQAQIDKRIHPHMFRHTFAAELAREGVPAAYIQRQLGHSSLATTTRYLSVLAPTEVIDAIMARPVPWETEDSKETDD